MRLLGLILLALPALAVACVNSAPSGPVTPADVRKNLHSWNGLEVVVVGWLGRCGESGPLSSCDLFTSKADIEASQWRGVESKDFARAWEHSLSIGGDDAFDKSAAPLQGQFVKIKGLVDDSCRRPDVHCTDRASDFEPQSIEPAIPQGT